MKAEIITVPNKKDARKITLYPTGLQFRNQEIYLESSGCESTDRYVKDSINRFFNLT